jgi:Ca-activated chloride channel family protein
MAFAWPLALLCLLVLPVLVAAYLWLIGRRRRRAVPYSSVALIRAAAPARAAWRRHAPFALVLGALACLGLAGARPQIRTEVPVAGSTVILALDVSGSMCATDVNPNRLTAAQEAVRTFVRTQDSHTRIGLVVFAGFAALAVPPTTERKDLLHAIDSLTTGRGTTIGAAILRAVDAIHQINPDVAPADEGRSATPGTSGAPAPSVGSVPVAPEIVVLLTDGANTSGISPLKAAQVAAARGVRVYPIGFGTANPTTLVCSAQQLGGSRSDDSRLGGFGGGSGGRGGGGNRGGGPGGGGVGRPSYLVADETTLRQVATTTGGAYFSASGADQLQGVLADLPRHVQAQRRDVEVSVVLAGLAAVLILLAAGAAARWTAFPT